MVCPRHAACAPNVTESGERIVQPPARAKGTWRGQQGYFAMQKVLTRTRFKIRPDADSPQLWCAWNMVASAEQTDPKKRKVPPLVCCVCGEIPAKLSFMNFVSSSKSSGQCSCSWRPKHATLEGHARLAELAAAANHELVDPGGDEWVRLHLRRSLRWELVSVRCKACGRERQIVGSGLVRNRPFSKCLCTRPPLGRSKKKTPAAPRAEGGSGDLIPSDEDL